MILSTSLLGFSLVRLFKFLLLFTLLPSGSEASLFARNSAFKFEDPPPIQHVSNNIIRSMSELLIARPVSSSASLLNARNIIGKLSVSSTCSQEITARLLRQCKAIRPQHQNPQAELQKENAQTAYAISMALCEERQARVRTSASCQQFQFDSVQALPDGSLEVFQQEDIEACSNDLYNTPSWTSLNVYKAQSRDLCDASRLDYQREELLAHFKQATDVLPDILEALSDHQHESQLLMAGIRQQSADILTAQQQTSDILDEQTQRSQEHLAEMAEFVIAHILKLGDAEESLKAAISNSLKFSTDELAVVQKKADKVNTNLAEIYAAAAEAVSSMSIEIGSQFDAVANRVDQVVNDVINLADNGHLETIQKSLSHGRQAAQEFDTVQTAQRDAAHAQLQLSQQVMRTIEDSQGRLDDIKKAVDLLPTSWFDGLHNIQQQLLRIKSEIKFALLFFAPSSMLLIIGRWRLSVSLILIYAFFRSSWSMIKDVDFLQVYSNLSNLTRDDFKTPALCLLALLIFCALTVLSSYFLRLLSQHSPIKNDAESQKHLPLATSRRCTLPTSDVKAASSQSFNNDTLRFQRAQSLPVQGTFGGSPRR